MIPVVLSPDEIEGIELKITEELTRDGQDALPHGVTSTLIEEVVAEYCKFLTLHVAFPEQRLVPSGWIDKAWHAHILFTRRYADTCNKLFGKFFHHDPCVKPQERAGLRSDYLATLKSYQELFEHAPPSRLWGQCGHADCMDGCGGRCGGCPEGCGHNVE